MKPTTLRIAVLAIALTLAWTAADAVTVSGSPASPTALHKSSDLIGLTVENTQGQKIGTVVDLVLDQNLNNVTYAIFSQRADSEWAYYALPFKDMKLNKAGNAIVLDTNAVNLQNLPAEERINVTRVWFQGPIDVEAEPYAAQRVPGMIDIYGRPIQGRAKTPYVQNVYKSKPGYDRSAWRGYERDQYGQPLFERQYYVGKDTFGHNGYNVERRQIYGRPLYRDLYRPYTYSPPSRSDWHWGSSTYGRPRYRGYDRFGRPLGQQRYRRYGTMDRDEYQGYSRPIELFGTYPYRLEGYDQYGRPIYSDAYPQQPLYGRPKTDSIGMGRWFRTHWQQDVGRLGLRRITNLIGTQVDAQNHDAGTIEDFAIDMGTGHIAYMIVSLAPGFAGAPNRLAAIPWQAVELFPQQRLAEVDISRSKLLGFAFNQGEMPNLGESNYARRLHQAFNVYPYWEVLGYVEPVAGAESLGSAWEPNSWYANEFNPDKIVTISGTIESISSFKPSPDSSAGLRLRIRTDDGRLLLVNAGPFNFANQKGMTFDTGERITVTGSRVQIAGQNVILASQLNKDDKTVQLRTRQGRPLW